MLTLSAREIVDLTLNIVQATLDFSHVVVDFFELGHHQLADDVTQPILEVFAIGLIPQGLLELQHLPFDLIQMLLVRIVHIPLSFLHPPFWGCKFQVHLPGNYTTYKL
jgi:hypothetical protein